jgi:hypothetical protein
MADFCSCCLFGALTQVTLAFVSSNVGADIVSDTTTFTLPSIRPSGSSYYYTLTGDVSGIADSHLVEITVPQYSDPSWVSERRPWLGERTRVWC